MITHIPTKASTVPEQLQVFILPHIHTLQIHLLSVSKWITTLGASGTRRVEVVVVTCLQHLAADVTFAVGTLYPKLGLVVLLAIREAVPGEKINFDIFFILN